LRFLFTVASERRGAVRLRAATGRSMGSAGLLFRASQSCGRGEGFGLRRVSFCRCGGSPGIGAGARSDWARDWGAKNSTPPRPSTTTDNLLKLNGFMEYPLSFAGLRNRGSGLISNGKVPNNSGFWSPVWKGSIEPGYYGLRDSPIRQRRNGLMSKGKGGRNRD
jgi:hypothetical protein